MIDRLTICSEKRLRELLEIEKRTKKLEAVADAAREYFTVDELNGLDFSPFCVRYNRAKDALKALDEYNNKGETP